MKTIKYINLLFDDNNPAKRLVVKEFEPDLKSPQVASYQEVYMIKHVFFMSGDANDMLVLNGYIRKKCKRYKMMMFTNDLIGVLRLFYQNELLHWITCVSRNQYYSDLYQHHITSLSRVLFV